MEYTNSEIERQISERIHNAKYRDIMRLRLIDGLTYERIAEIAEMSPRRILRRLLQHRSHDKAVTA